MLLRRTSTPKASAQLSTSSGFSLRLIASALASSASVVSVAWGLNAAAVDKRIKAVVTTSMYDMSRTMAKGLNDSLTKEQRAQMLEKMSQQRWVDAGNGSPAAGPRILPEALERNSDPITQEFFDYYRTPRGFHKNAPNSSGAWTATSPMSFMNLPLLTYIGEISPRPILLIAGDNAHSRYFSEDIYKAAAQQRSS
jgi:fermentation-respiration switch protein FrsA (DUF1100 family)